MNFFAPAASVRPRSKIAYRPDIDGLRAIAVLSVCAYHFGVRSLAGGFVGVDIFFVISGYLITSNVAKEIKEGHFSFVSFYKRRVRRLLPAYFVVAFSTMAAGYYFLLPEGFESLASQVIYSTFGAANFFFLWNSGGYFDAPTTLMPMLHMWSLAVEEQFYLVWPALLLCSTLIQRRLSGGGASWPF